MRDKERIKEKSGKRMEEKETEKSEEEIELFDCDSGGFFEEIALKIEKISFDFHLLR